MTLSSRPNLEPVSAASANLISLKRHLLSEQDQHPQQRQYQQVQRQHQQQPYIVPPCRDEVEIIYQDEHLLLVRKPQLLLTIPGRHPKNSDSLISRLRRCFPNASIVHRLDLDTSGLMVVPLCKNIHSHISRQFQERQVKKLYTAIVFGIVGSDKGTIDLPIACDWENRPLQKICFKTGKSALSHFEVSERFPEYNCTRVLLKPITGRSHQLRIHLAQIGHPILGCDLYAHTQAFRKTYRLMLHATALEFEHPESGRKFSGVCDTNF